MRSLIIASVAALSLASCTTTGSIDSAIQKNLPQICSAAATAHSAFVIVASTGDIKQRTVAREAAAYAALDAICKDPGSVTAATALVKAAEAYAAITLALREAKAAE
ncbi:cell wall anchor protein [Sinorhizobium meliloti]|uniref:cell wall anchor protein n=1 Tax=Rhizobium meliloti TaxID=382 RepID=UPI00299F15C5|nr:cell wall anchor protein [Sinorhizobium meliloti]MDW9660107.1 cell wall anchor protein [Sinorhizobium meliloti]MDX0049676.1 cell wall anchor protein [Sinorhizobium meliloti]